MGLGYQLERSAWWDVGAWEQCSSFGWLLLATALINEDVLERKYEKWRREVTRVEVYLRNLENLDCF